MKALKRQWKAENGDWNLEDILERNDNGKLSNPNDKADWVLYWWKK